MFIKLFKSGYSLQLIILLLALIILWVESFIAPMSGTHEYTPAPFYNYLYFLLRNLTLLQVILAFLLIIVQAYLLNNILIENGFIRKNSLLPAFVYILIISQSKDLQTIYPALLANLFLIIAFHYLLKVYYEIEAYTKILNAAFLVGLASLFYLPSIFFITLFWITFITYSIFKWREWIISIIGVLIPFIFLFTFYFWVDRFNEMISKYLAYFGNLILVKPHLSIPGIVIISMIGLFILLAVNRIIISLNTKTISIRKKSIILIWFFVISLTSILYGSRSRIDDLAITFIPASGLISYYFSDIKKRWIIEILFLLTILMIFVFRFIRYA